MAIAITASDRSGISLYVKDKQLDAVVVGIGPADLIPRSDGRIRVEIRLDRMIALEGDLIIDYGRVGTRKLAHVERISFNQKESTSTLVLKIIN